MIEIKKLVYTRKTVQFILVIKKEPFGSFLKHFVIMLVQFLLLELDEFEC